MQKFTLFTLMLVLVSTILLQISFANEKESAKPTTEISEGTEKQNTDTNEVVSTTASSEKENSSEDKVSYGVVSEYEMNLAKMTQTQNQTVAPALEQDEIKVKKLKAVKAFVKSKNGKLSDAAATKVAEAALYANQRNELDLALILAVMWKESTFNYSVVGGSCYGLMQIHKNTAKGFGYTIDDIKDPYKAADLGARLLKGHIKNYNNISLGLTAYNAGAGNVKKGNYTTAYANNVIQKQKVIQAYLDSQLKSA